MTFSRVLCAGTMAVLVPIPAAKAQLGEMPGTGGVGGAPHGPPPACQQLSVLRDEYQKNGTALSVANEKARTQHKPPDMETCKLFKAFQASQAKFVRGMADNQATCGVPPDAIKAAQEEQGKVAQVTKQVCNLAEHRHAPAQPADPIRATIDALRPEKPEGPIPAYDPYFLGPDFERGGGRGRPGPSRRNIQSAENYLFCRVLAEITGQLAMTIATGDRCAASCGDVSQIN